MKTIDRRTFLRGSVLYGGGLAIAGPLQAFAAQSAAGAPRRSLGYGALRDAGDLRLPPGFNYKVISRQGDPMSDGNPTPGIFDGMAAYGGPKNTTILIRNHENRRRANEIPVVVPPELRYDSDPSYNAGNTKLVVGPNREVLDSFAVLGGTSTNCAGGETPWGSWIASEEVFDSGDQPHGYNFEIDAFTDGPVKAVPIKAAGRFVHEAVVYLDGILYETEDRSDNSCLYRYTPTVTPTKPGDLAASAGKLEALRIVGMPNADTDVGWPVGQAFEVDWVEIDEPEPASDSAPTGVRFQAAAKGAAAFDRQEGMWVGDGKVYFDCTSGGAADQGQVWVLDPARSELTLIYESPGEHELDNPDNLVVVPATGELMLCEDGDEPTQFLRGLTLDGEIYDFAESVSSDSEFCGACFDPKGKTLYVSQQGGRPDPPAVTYAIWGPWQRQGAPGL
jgi:uncharacterized protein